ncbi:MAG: DUF4157 domain-containing protein [Cyanobacteria bacterium P01_E01_bin.42]
MVRALVQPKKGSVPLAGKSSKSKSLFSRPPVSTESENFSGDDSFPVSGEGMDLDWGSIPVDPPESAPRVQAAPEETEEKEIQEKEDKEEVQPKESAIASSEDEDNKIQAKLSIGAPGDKYEQEADRVARKVIEMDAPAPQDSVQRQTEVEEDEVKPKIQAKGQATNATADFESSLSRGQGGGSPLGNETQDFMESRFGTDFGGVRVHTDSNAVQMNKDIGAQAFTHGQDIYFNSGKYNPGSSSGKELLAHELTHTVQQSGGSVQAKYQQEENSERGTKLEKAQGRPLPVESDGDEHKELKKGETQEQRVRSQLDKETQETKEAKKQDNSTKEAKQSLDKSLPANGEKESAQTQPLEAPKSEGQNVAPQNNSTGEKSGQQTESKAPSPPTTNEAPSGDTNSANTDPAAEFEGLVDEQVSAYMNGNVSPDRLTALNAQTQGLLDGASALSEKNISQPDSGNLLGSLTGITALKDAVNFDKSPPGYDKEDSWLQTVARIRDIASALGSVVGTIGLLATIGGAILTLLIPPVGVFLTTVGKFSDMAALILNIISLVLSGVLTGYNIYRLVHATNPEEKKRLFGLVQQEVVNTTASGLAVGLSVMPSASKTIGKGSKNVVKPISTGFKTGAKTLAKSTAKGSKSIGKGILGGGKAVVKGFGRGGKTFGKGIAMGGKTFGKEAGKISKMLGKSQVFKPIGRGFKIGTKAIKKEFSKGAKAIGQAFKGNKKDMVKGLVTGAKSFGKGFARGGKTFGKGIVMGGKTFGKEASKISKMLSKSQVLKPIGKGFSNGSKAIGKGFSNGSKAIGKGFKTGFKVVKEGLMESGQTIGKGFSIGAKTFGENVKKTNWKDFGKLTLTESLKYAAGGFVNESANIAKNNLIELDDAKKIISKSTKFVTFVQGRICDPIYSLPDKSANQGIGKKNDRDLASIAMGQQTSPETPPSPVLYSPDSLAHLSESKLEIAKAVETVNQYIGTANRSEQDNKAASEVAQTLKEKNTQQQDTIKNEQQDIVGQKDKLSQADGAQQKMSQESERASSEAQKGQNEGEKVQSEGGNVNVEGKEEPKEEKNWLEKAWDATGGAIWENMVRPAIDFVKGKINQIMQKVNEFIMGIIEQTCGLDDIKAELNAGGQDIVDKGTSLDETNTGLQETSDQTEQAKQQNDETIMQAQSNIDEAVGVRAEAEQLLTALTTHHALLEQEESIAKSYIAEFGTRYQDFFSQQNDQPEQTDSSDQSEPTDATPEVGITQAEITPIKAHIQAIQDAENNASQELNQVSSESSGSISPELQTVEREVTTGAIAEFNAKQSQRLGKSAQLLAQAESCNGLSQEEGSAKLQGIMDELATLTQELEQDRMTALQTVAQMHEQAIAVSEEPSEEDGEEMA